MSFASSDTVILGPQVGAWLTVTVAEEKHPGAFAATAEEWPHWHCTLRTRHGLHRQGTVSAWILDVDTQHRHIAVTLDAFGRLPVSERMFIRYERGLLGLIDILEHELSDFDPELCAEVKGMYSRTFKKDQVDWLSVYEVLGRPVAPFARSVAEQLRLLGRGIRMGDVLMAEAAHRELNGMGALSVFREALQRLNEPT